MRYLLDTNIFIYLSTDHDKLDPNVYSILSEPETLMYISAESVRELIVAYNNKGWGNKKWKTAEDMVRSIEETHFVEILPIAKDVMQTYSRLSVNKTMNHKDPSDHVIISHSMTLGIPLISSDTRFPYYTRQGLNLIFNEK
ncbi:MAG: PIN domain-containing protein [Bacteroidaceae bacterium]|jgi:PIN domain nuclease of toxin-antitoxin system|nr:PIN domain-containing protein [Bacteroidaceae bacterium]